MPKLLALVLLTAAMTSHAQVRMGFGGAGLPFPGQTGIGGFGNVHSGIGLTIGPSQGPFHHHHFFPGAVFLGEPWLADYAEVGVQQAPQVIVVQQPAAPVSETKDEPKPVAPLMIELRGDHYVRYGGLERSGASEISASSPTSFQAGAGAPRKGGSQASAPELPAAVLIFRDGHREEAASYAIFGGTMYLNSNYWTSGAWTRKIQLADLDLPGTAQLNQERGVKFILPSAPNEVVTRP